MSVAVAAPALKVWLIFGSRDRFSTVAIYEAVSRRGCVRARKQACF
jgi:hypothetical protein